MVLVKVYNSHHFERGLIECEFIENYDRNSLICVNTECVYGAVDVIDYIHTSDISSIVISARDLLRATAA